jgi:hypothetical protein
MRLPLACAGWAVPDASYRRFQMPSRQPPFSRARHSRRWPLVRVADAARMTVATDGDTQTLIDLSHAGCVVRSRTTFRAGEPLHLTFTLDDCLSFIVPVRVAYARREPGRQTSLRPHYLIGFEFDVRRQPDLHRVIEILLESTNVLLSVH